MYRKISLVDAEKVYIKTFGGFDLYYRGKEIDFSNAKAKELCIPSFVSVLFGITEPALFGVNIRYRYPLAGGQTGSSCGVVQAQENARQLWAGRYREERPRILCAEPPADPVRLLGDAGGE